MLEIINLKVITFLFEFVLNNKSEWASVQIYTKIS